MNRVEKTKTKSQPKENSRAVSPPQNKEPVRARLTFGRIFQSLAYVCLFLGLMACLGVVVAAMITYWPQSQPSATMSENQSVSNESAGSWIWPVLTGSIPGFIPILQIVIGVVGILIVFWGWRAAVRATRRLVVRVADEFLWQLPVVEPLMLAVTWLLAIIGAWWLAAPDLFLSLTAICGGFLIFGLICFWLMRWLAGSRLDLTRADLALKKI